MFNLSNKIYSNNNNLLLENINDLNQLMNYYKNNLSIKILGNIIDKINYIINENKKNLQLLRNDISKLSQKIDNLNINNINKQKIKYYGKYIGEVENGLPEGKGTWYGDNGNRYEGYWRNGIKEGKGIFYYNNGDRYEGDFRNGEKEGKGIYYYKSGNRYEGDNRNDKKEGKGIFYWNNGDRYEGDYRNDKIEGKGIYYYSNGDREMGDYYNGEEIGKHVTLTSNGEVKINNNDFIKESEFN